ncbi:MAG: hypothetical protein ACTSWY_03600 [Promethearchaeota archaeon]
MKKTKIFSDHNEGSIIYFLKIVKYTLIELGMKVTTNFLNNTLIEIIGMGAPGTLLKKNKVTLYFEDNNLFVKFKGKMDNPNRFWKFFEQNVKIYGDSTEEFEKNYKIEEKIKFLIEQKGSIPNTYQCFDLLISFKKENSRFPTSAEIESISLNFIKETGFEKKIIIKTQEKITDLKMTGEKEETDREKTRNENTTEVLKEIIKEIKSLSQDEKKRILSIITDLPFEKQKKMVSKIKLIESDLDKIPDLDINERVKIRKNIMNLTIEKRRLEILKIIKQRK